VYRQLDRPAEALFAAQRAADLGHFDPQICRSLGYFHWTLGRWQDSLAARQRAQDLGDDSPHLQLDLGATLLKLGRAREALPHLEAARAELKQAPYVHARLAEAYFALGRYAEALAACEREIGLRPAAKKELQSIIDRARAATSSGPQTDGGGKPAPATRGPAAREDPNSRR